MEMRPCRIARPWGDPSSRPSKSARVGPLLFRPTILATRISWRLTLPDARAGAVRELRRAVRAGDSHGAVKGAGGGVPRVPSGPLLPGRDGSDPSRLRRETHPADARLPAGERPRKDPSPPETGGPEPHRGAQ